MAPLTILHLVANRWWTGSADPTLRLLQELKARGHRVLLGAVHGDRFEAKAREAGIALLGDLSLDPRFQPIPLVRDLRRLRRLVAREGVQIVHCHHSHDHWLGALTRGRAALLRTFHVLRAVRSGWPFSLLRRWTDGVFAVSRQIQARSTEVGFEPSQVWFLPGAVDLGRFSPIVSGKAIRDELGLGDAPVIGSVARLAPNRGHELLIEGFRLLLRQVPEARLLVVGKGEARPRLQRLVGELGLGDRILFIGYRDSDLPQVLAALDCFVLMGGGSDESCRAALEAMAAGKPVVARRVSALPETIADGETGLLIPDDRPESVTRALAEILRDPERARRMGTAGRLRAERDFHPEQAVRVVEGAYHAVLARRASGNS
ncbi:MAG: glycosyltransferase family 4 protein [Candidatus Rokubacteria bacterium]|nr:glycosyltransferase family 4 protein [Candidatus Rokubacteria bacterium]